MAKSTVEQPQYAKYCFFCGSPNATAEHHFIFGRGIRNLAEEDGIKAHICDRCHTVGKLLERVHDNAMAEKLSKMFGQAIYERNTLANKEVETVDEAREKFRRRYGQCYY
jgi:hypothetical protein